MAFSRSRQSAPLRREWPAPRLNKRIWLFNDPDDDNEAGTQVWAARRDIRTQVSEEEGATAYELRTIFTIRHRDGIAANVVVVHGQERFQSTGLPQLRGGEGRYQKQWLQIETVQRE